MIVSPAWKTDLANYLNQTLTKTLFEFQCEELPSEAVKFTHLQISHSSKFIAYISNEGKVLVFNLEEQKVIRTISPSQRDEKFTLVQFDPRIDAIYVASTVFGIRIYNIHTGEVIDEYPIQNGTICVDAKISITKTYLVCAFDNGNIVAYNTKHADQTVFFANGHENVKGLVITRNEKLVLTVSSNELKIWVFPEFKPLFEPLAFEDSSGEIRMKLSESEKFLLLKYNEQMVHVYNLETMELLHKIEEEEQLGIIDFVLTKDEQILMMLTSDSSVIFYSFKESKEITRLKTLKYDDPMGLILSPDLRFFAVASSRGAIVAFELLSFSEIIDEYDVYLDGLVSNICLTSNQKYLISTEHRGTITVLDIESNQVFCSYSSNYQSKICCMALSSDDKYLVIGGENKTFILFRLDFSEGKTQIIKELESSILPDTISQIAITSNNSHIVSELNSGDIHAFHLASQQIQLIPNQRINSHLRFERIKASKAGSNLVFGNDKGSLKIINLLTRKLIYEFKNVVPSPITALASSDNLIAVGALDSTISLVWLDQRRIEHIFTSQESRKVYSSNLLSSYIEVIKSLAFNSDDSFLVAASAHNVMIFETIKGNQLYSFRLQPEILSTQFYQNNKHIITFHINGRAKVHKIPFLSEICVVGITDYSLNVPYRAMSKIPEYKLSKLWNNQINISPQVVQSFYDSYTFPYKINFWYYYFLTQQSFHEPSIITNWIIDSDIPVFTDMDGLNIIYYLVKSKEITSLNTIFKRAEEALDNAPLNVFTSLSEIMDEIIASKAPQLSNFLDTCVSQPEIAGVKPLKLGDTNGKALFVFSSDRKLTINILEMLVKEGIDPLAFYTSKIRLDPNFLSEKNLKILGAIYRTPNTDIYRSKIILKLIDAAWLTARYLLWFKALLDLGLVVCISIIVSYKPDEPTPDWLKNFLLGYNSLLLAYEILQCYGDFKLYSRSLLNLIDIMRIALVYTTIISADQRSPDQTVNDDETPSKVAGVVIFTIFFSYLKILIHFRLLKPARRLIRLLVEVVTDMFTFTLFYAIIIFGLSYMKFIVGLLFQSEPDLLLGNILGEVYLMSLGQFNTSSYDILAWIWFVLSTFLLAVILLQLIVAIITDTFERSSENAAHNDYIEKLDLILESFLIQRTIRKLLPFRKTPKNERIVNRKYLFWVDELRVEGQNEKEEAAWEAGIKDIRKDIETYVHKQNSATSSKLSLVVKAITSLVEAKKQSWKVYYKEQKLNEKATQEYLKAKEELDLMKKKFNISLEDTVIEKEEESDDAGFDQEDHLDEGHFDEGHLFSAHTFASPTFRGSGKMKF